MGVGVFWVLYITIFVGRGEDGLWLPCGVKMSGELVES
jgi:hypothetical protein